MKLPAFQFYPGDWRKDPGVQSLDYFARGVWFEILCLMHESERRGFLLLNGKPMPEPALASLLGIQLNLLKQNLSKIEGYGVASRDEKSGALICRRMIRDEYIREVRREAGKQGGNPSLLNQNPSKTEPKPENQDNQIPTPSSSSSISSSNDLISNGGTPPKEISFEKKYAWFIEQFNKICNRKFEGDATSKNSFKARLNEKRTAKEILLAITNGFKDAQTWDSVKHFTPEYILRPAMFAKYLADVPETTITAPLKKSLAEQKAHNASIK